MTEPVDIYATPTGVIDLTSWPQERKALLADAQEIVQRHMDLQQAMTTAVAILCEPDVNLVNLDETAEPKIDQEVQDKIRVFAAAANEASMYRDICLFFGLPAEIVDVVTQEFLESKSKTTYQALMLLRARAAPT